MGTNLGGTFLCTKHALRHMRPRRSGHIINLHGGGTTQPPGACVYVTSKEAIRTFTRFVAEEEREANICIVLVSPGGAIATEDASEEAKKALPGPEAVGDVFVQAAQAGMESSGKLFRAWEGKLHSVEPA
jgi:3-oxoacyl-[acyl-carrier protein] reductase